MLVLGLGLLPGLLIRQVPMNLQVRDIGRHREYNCDQEAEPLAQHVTGKVVQELAAIAFANVGEIMAAETRRLITAHD